MWDDALATLAGALIGGGIGSALVSFLLERWKERDRARHARKRTELDKLHGPLLMLFDRTKRAMGRWLPQKNLLLEAEVIRKSNQAIRDLLLARGALIPPQLLEPAGQLIEHYDEWLEAYELHRRQTAAEHQPEFVFASKRGFPRGAEEAFAQRRRELHRELYGT